MPKPTTPSEGRRSPAADTRIADKDNLLKRMRKVDPKQAGAIGSEPVHVTIKQRVNVPGRVETCALQVYVSGLTVGMGMQGRFLSALEEQGYQFGNPVAAAGMDMPNTTGSRAQVS